MPMYAFRCNECGSEFEELSRADPGAIAAVECPQCGSRNHRRKLTAASFTMAGRESSSPPTACSLGGGCGNLN